MWLICKQNFFQIPEQPKSFYHAWLLLDLMFFGNKLIICLKFYNLNALNNFPSKTKYLILPTKKYIYILVHHVNNFYICIFKIFNKIYALIWCIFIYIFTIKMLNMIRYSHIVWNVIIILYTHSNMKYIIIFKIGIWCQYGKFRWALLDVLSSSFTLNFISIEKNQLNNHIFPVVCQIAVIILNIF